MNWLNLILKSKHSNKHIKLNTIVDISQNPLQTAKLAVILACLLIIKCLILPKLSTLSTLQIQNQQLYKSILKTSLDIHTQLTAIKPHTLVSYLESKEYNITQQSQKNTTLTFYTTNLSSQLKTLLKDLKLASIPISKLTIKQHPSVQSSYIVILEHLNVKNKK